MNRFSQYFRSDFQELARRYSERLPVWEKFAERVKEKVEEALQKSRLEYIRVEYRIKSLESFLEKCMRRNFNNPFTDIRDIIGFRIIFPFVDDLDNFHEMVNTHFDVVERTNKRDAQGYKVFAYEAIHYHLLLDGTMFELQLRTLIQNTWAVLDQRLFYKTRDTVPHHIRRKMNRLVALFEIAEDEFKLLRGECLDYIQIYSKAKSQSLSPLPLNIMSLEAFHRTCYKDLTFVKENVDMTINLLKQYGIETIGDLKDAMEETEHLRQQQMERMPDYSHYFDVYLYVVISWLKSGKKPEMIETPTAETEIAN
jgi:ppGpp synthetase/RelA/SpoT-type nucleotidyltranferase